MGGGRQTEKAARDLTRLHGAQCNFGCAFVPRPHTYTTQQVREGKFWAVAAGSVPPGTSG